MLQTDEIPAELYQSNVFQLPRGLWCAHTFRKPGLENEEELDPSAQLLNNNNNNYNHWSTSQSATNHLSTSQLAINYLSTSQLATNYLSTSQLAKNYLLTQPAS